MYKINFSTQQISRKNTKVVVTFYLRLRNEFQPFSAKNYASDWLTCWVSKSEAWFLAGNGWNSFLNLRKKVATTFKYLLDTFDRYKNQALWRLAPSKCLEFLQLWNFWSMVSY